MTRARVALVALAAAISMAAGACTGPGRPVPAPARTSRDTTGPIKHGRTVSPLDGPSATGAAGEPTTHDVPFCSTSMTPAWKAARTFGQGDGYLWGVSVNGLVQWAEPELSWAASDGSRSRIARLPAPGGLGMAWMVGDHVAFENARSEQNWGDWELFLWDSTKQARPVRLDESDGNVPNAPFLLVANNDTQLAWLHPLKDGRREVRVHDVTTGKTRVVHVGHEGAPFIAGRLLVWPEAFAPDTPTKLVAVDLVTLKPAVLPQPLAELRDPQEMSTDGHTYAWATMDRRKLMVWRPGWPAVRVIVEQTEGDPVTWPKVSGDTVSWVAERTYTADLRSGSYAPMTKQAGAAEVWGRFLRIGVSKAAGKSFYLDTSRLPPLPRCS